MTDPSDAALCDRLVLPIHAFAWGDVFHDAGLKRDAAYLVRPDGYVAVAANRGSACLAIEHFISRFDLACFF